MPLLTIARKEGGKESHHWVPAGIDGIKDLIKALKKADKEKGFIVGVDWEITREQYEADLLSGKKTKDWKDKEV